MARYSYHRKDTNADAIRDALEAVGATVDPRCPGDYLVGFKGANWLLEVKTARGKQRATQKRFQARWKGQYAVVRTVEQAWAVIGFTPIPARGVM